MKNKNVCVVGLGKSGVSAAKFLHSLNAHVWVTEKRVRSSVKSDLNRLPSKVKVQCGQNTWLKKNWDLIVVSPGVPWDLPLLKKARSKGTLVLPEFELGWRFITPAKTIAITGTNGKTTTTALLGHLLRKAKIPSIVAGNIGTPLTSCINKITFQTHLVLEVSSYQAEAHQQFNPDIGIWLNLTPDHLGRHKSMKNYAAMKTRLFKNCDQYDLAILNKQDPWIRKMSKRIKARKCWFKNPSLMSLAKHLAIPGNHNLQNAMAACAAALDLGVSRKLIIEGLKSFQGVEHRLQVVGRKKNVTYINDSKATNVGSTLVALEAMGDNVSLIMGGQHKGNSYKPLIPYIKKKVKRIFTIGEAASLIHRDLKNIVPIDSCRTLSRAITQVRQVVKEKDTVLFSPACASFDQYKNFEERGHHFMRLINK